MYKLVVLSVLVAVVVARTRYLNSAEHTSAYSSSVATPTSVSQQSRVDVHRSPLISTTYAAPAAFAAPVAVAAGPVAVAVTSGSLVTPTVHTIVSPDEHNVHNVDDSDDIYTFTNREDNVHENQEAQDIHNAQNTHDIHSNQDAHISHETPSTVAPVTSNVHDNQNRNNNFDGQNNQNNFDNQNVRINFDNQNARRNQNLDNQNAPNFNNQNRRNNYDNQNVNNNFDNRDIQNLRKLGENQRLFNIHDGQIFPNREEVNVFRNIPGQDFGVVSPVVKTLQAHGIRTISTPLGHSVDTHDSHSVATHDIQPVVSRDGKVQPVHSSVSHSSRLDVHQSAQLVPSSIDVANPSARHFETSSPAW